MLLPRHGHPLACQSLAGRLQSPLVHYPWVVVSSCPHSAPSTSGRLQQQGSIVSSRQPQRRATAARAGDVSTGSPKSATLADDPKLMRRLLLATSAAEALEISLQQPGSSQSIRPEDAQLLLSSSLEQGNIALALSIYREMCVAKQAQSQSSTQRSPWPEADLDTTAAVVLGLCRQVRVNDAVAVMESIRSQGVPRAEEVSFGKVVNSPLAPSSPLAVVAPQEGSKVVADAASRYEFELYSGSVVSCKSEALAPSGSPLAALSRALGLNKRPPAAAVHELVLQAPDGTSRTFRVGTATADVPGQKGERLTIVSAPSRGSSSKLRRLLLSTSPPGTKPGQAMAATNHATGAVLQLLEPPQATTTTSIPSWVLPVAVVLAGGDAASGLINPALPAALAVGAAALAGSAVAGNTLLLPRLKQLPPNAVKLESMRQELLAKHSGLEGKVNATLQEAVEDVRTLAKLWQLQVKMQSVGGSRAAYEARIERITTARTALEQRLAKRLELLDGYARVMNMIEIEVEMELQVPAEELAGIEEQMVRLEELEELREEWTIAAEAQDEVEKLLRNTSLPTSA